MGTTNRMLSCATENARIVPADVEHPEPLEVQMAVQCLDEHLPGRGEEGVEGPGPEGDCGIEFKVHDKRRITSGIKGRGMRAVRK